MVAAMADASECWGRRCPHLRVLWHEAGWSQTQQEVDTGKEETGKAASVVRATAYATADCGKRCGGDGRMR